MSSGGGPDEGGFDFDETTGSLGLDLDDEEESVSQGEIMEDRWEDDEMEEPVLSAVAPPPPPAAAPAMQAAPMELERGAPLLMKSRSIAFGGITPQKKRDKGGGGGRAAAPPPEPLPPRFRHAYLRLEGPDEDHRGELREVAALEHLYQLLEDHEAAHESDLHRAMQALTRAADRLWSLELPAGTRNPRRL